MPSKKQSEEKYFLGTKALGLPLIPEAGINNILLPNPLGEHHNPGFEFTYVYSGEVCWKVVNGPDLRLSGGDFSIMADRVRHSGEFNIIRPCKLFWMVVDPLAPKAECHTTFSRKDLADFKGKMEKAGNCVLPADPEMEARFAELWKICREYANNQKNSLYTHRLRLLLLQFLVDMVSAFDTHRSRTGNAAIADILDYIAAHLDSPLQVEEVASQAGLRPSRFYELFRKETGQTPADYINRMRCERARHMLRNSKLPITHIAMELGYSSSQYFANCFRKYTGMNPGRYRSIYGKK
ncbi:MAG: helix-turn-helix domain-containing protein [Planctomycetes bacterium]|nr:helix-turn-helix domain-containing protein [Planctomycetota bacterium]